MESRIFVFALLFCAATTGFPVYAESEADPLVALRKEYFPMLDFRAGPKHVQEIPKFAARLSALADAERVKLAEGKLTSEAEKARAGLIFIYDAMMTTNNTIGLTQKALSLTSLIEARRFGAENADPRAELLARAAYSVKSLEDAAKLRPNDRRIDSWLAGAKIIHEKIETGDVSERALAEALATVAVRPSFNLWSAIILFKDLDEKSSYFGELLTESQKFVDAIRAGANSCKNNPEDCRNGANAPHNLQAAIVELGDVFLRGAEFFASKGDIGNAMKLSMYAQGTYKMLSSPENAEATQKWPDKEALDERLEYAKKFNPMNKQVVPGTFRALKHYQRAYDCASCHGRAGAPNPF